MQGNIVGVFVGDIEVSRDRDMIDEDSFEVVTSQDNRYRIVRDLGLGSFAWDVRQITDSGVTVDVEAGHVTGVRSLFTRRPTSFAYISAHHLLDSGNQNDFLNAVQSLTD
jgi:hypothetical protein